MKRLTPDCRPPSDKRFLVYANTTQKGPEWFVAKASYEDCFEGGITLRSIRYYDEFNNNLVSVNMTSHLKDTIIGWAELPSTRLEEEK